VLSEVSHHLPVVGGRNVDEIESPTLRNEESEAHEDTL
jgi:hypothetical protein